MNEAPNKILIIQLRQIGDCLLTTPVIKVLRDHFKTSHIAFLIEKHCCETVSQNPYLDEVIVLDRKRYKEFRYYLRELSQIRKKKFDMVFDFLCNPRSAFITFLSGAKHRVGYDFPGRKQFYNVVVKRENPKYVVDYKFDALKRMGIYPKSGEDRKPLFFTGKEDDAFADDFFNQNDINASGLVISISSTGRKSYGMWDAGKWADVCTHLIKKYDAKIILTHAPWEKSYVDAIKSKALAQGSIYLPQTDNLKQLGAILKRSRLHIGISSGTVHLATALGVPTLTVYWRKESVCWTYPSGSHVGIERDNFSDITAEDVMREAEKLLGA